MEIILQNEIIDTILNSYKDELGKNFGQYKNHVYRVYNFVILLNVTENDLETLSVAAAFHDLGIWTNKTFDYIKPSVELATKYCLSKNFSNNKISEIATTISEHHKFSAIRTSKLAEIFRLADMTDLTLGFIRNGIERKKIKQIQKTFPNKRFHINLTKLFFNNLFINPLKPLPMYKFVF